MFISIKKIATILLFPALCFSQTKPLFKTPENSYLTATDLHIHTVFSDGSVWPDIRLKEAIREGLDLIALTEHLEYQPHEKDIPNPDRNRSYEIASDLVKDQEKLRVINGAEITRDMPPGHINAVFVKDANKLLIEDPVSAIMAANKQKAFVFWNHPNWDAQRSDGIAKLEPLHKDLIQKKLIHGVEVVNETTYSEEALKIALENNLTIIGNSDIHGLTDWLFEIPEGGHRPITFVLSEDRSIDGIKSALFKGRTVVWFKDMLIGKENNLLPVLKANLSIENFSYPKGKTIAEITLINHCAAPLMLKYTGPFSFHADNRIFQIPSYSKKILKIKTLNNLDNIALPFELLNGIVAPKENLKFKLIASKK
jgi:hypothetical protein